MKKKLIFIDFEKCNGSFLGNITNKEKIQCKIPNNLHFILFLRCFLKIAFLLANENLEEEYVIKLSRTH